MTIATIALAAALAAAPLTQAPRPTPSISVQVTGAGRPLILIPGFLSSGDVWQGVVDHFKDHYQCHVVSIAGFAGAPAADDTTLKKIRDEVIAYASARQLHKPVLVGHSMGGVLALWIAETAPDLPSAVMSIDGVPFLPALMNPGATAETARAQAAQMRALYASLTKDQLAAQTRVALQGMISNPADIERATTWAANSDPKTAATLLEDLMTTDLRGDLSRIPAPVLLVPAVGAMAASPDMMKAALAAYERQIEPVRVHDVVPARTLHFVMLDDPAFLLKTMDDFLARRLPEAKQP